MAGRSGKRVECVGCRDAVRTIPLEMAFQPIVDTAARRVFAYEALVRGMNGEPAAHVIESVTGPDVYVFDQTCRVRAITLAAELGLAGLGSSLSINFLPNAIYEPRACLRLTAEAAATTGFPIERLIFEITETELVKDPDHLARIVAAYRDLGLRTAIDDFGAGHSNLDLLTRFQPDIIKLDMGLIRNVATDRIRYAIVRHTLALCWDIGIAVIAEGIETEAEYHCLVELGVTLMQGYLFARPGFRSLPAVSWPD